MRDGVGKEVGWSAVCVKESDRVEKQKCPEKADIYAPPPTPSSPPPPLAALIAHSGTYILSSAFFFNCRLTFKRFETIKSSDLFKIRYTVISIMAGKDKKCVCVCAPFVCVCVCASDLAAGLCC